MKECSDLHKICMEHEIVRGIKETGVKRIRLHDLRHSHASLVELSLTIGNMSSLDMKR